MTVEYRHIPVMRSEVVAMLDPHPSDVICDCTLGGAGHSIELAQHLSSDGLIIGIDQDEMALAAAHKRFEKNAVRASWLFLKGNFEELDSLLIKAEVPEVDCFLFDLGVSSAQLDIPSRGFSYKKDAPLDMRMDLGKDTLTAAEVINTYNAADLSRILRVYGDEKFAPSIVSAIVKRRREAPIRTTLELAELVSASIPAHVRRHSTHHPARKTFQALRIEVNHELDVLERGLKSAIRWSAPKGRICVISYHSLEDRLVKHIFSEMAKACICPPDLPVCVCHHVPIVEVITKKPLTPNKEELRLNPRARSALMRVAKKLDVTQSGVQ